MRTFRRFLHDIRAFVRGRLTDDDLSDELDTFLEASVTHKMQSGMSREEATRTARLEVGSALAVRDAVGDVGWTATWEATWRDVRYGVRSLARNGSFTLAAVTTLASASVSPPPSSASSIPYCCNPCPIATPISSYASSTKHDVVRSRLHD